MGIITVSIDDKTEKVLRKIAIARFQKRKGYLGKAIGEAIDEWAEKNESGVVLKSLELLEKGMYMGGIISKDREDLHKR